ncbi:right-handed parallel beta-helix repeat-containing protein, partial [bacterium]|nr:right-handed parallel beta-helix repeat-containing protein [candidate division CSSED10-310 bacterium]
FFYGGGIFCSTGYPIIGGTGNGNTFADNKAGAGSDLFGTSVFDPPLQANANSFGGYFLSDYYVSPLQAFNLDGSTSDLEPITEDVYVSASGSDSNDGLTWDTAFLTLDHAMSRVYGTASAPVTVYVGPGNYAASVTGERFPLSLVSNISIQGDDMEQTIFDAEKTSPVAVSHSETGSGISDVSLLNGNKDGILCELNSHPSIQNCRIESTDGIGIYCYDHCNPTVTNSIVAHNSSTGIYCSLYASPLILQTTILDNVFSGITCEAGSSPRIDYCHISDTSAVQGYGIYCWSWSDPIITNTTILNNESTGIYFEYECRAEITNCLIARNGGSGIECYEYCSPEVKHTTVAENTVNGLFCYFNCQPTITNSIFWDNLNHDEIATSYESRVSITFSDVRGGYAGVGNIYSNPKFTDGAFGSYYLSQIASGQHETSLCVDSGSGQAVDFCYETPAGVICMSDLTTRTDDVLDSDRVDMGYHYPPQQIPPLGIYLNLSGSMFQTGDAFILTATISNPGPETYTYQPIVVLLDVYSTYFWYPVWSTAFNSMSINIPVGTMNMEMLNFIWPTVSYNASDLRFMAAILNKDMTAILGEWDSVSFGWTASE